MISQAALKKHQISHAFGTTPSRAEQFAPIISQMIEKLGVSELLDYGCGRGELVAALKVPSELTLQLYDPAVDEYKGEPVQMQMVACIDVLEHVEAEYRRAVLDDLKRVTGAVLFLAVKDEPFSEWLEELMDRFEIQTLQVLPEGFYVIAFSQPAPLVEVANVPGDV